MPKWTFFKISFLWKHQSLCFHYWDYLTNFWRNNWQSIIDVVERLTCRTIAVDSFLLQKLHDFDVCQWGVVEGLQSRWGIFQACQILQATNTAQTIIWNISIILHGYWLFPRLNYWKRLGKETACIAQYKYIRTVSS